MRKITIVFQHDNARPHTSVFTLPVIKEIGFEVVEHLPYRTDLAPSDFWLFPMFIKTNLKGIHFPNDDKRNAKVRKWFQY